MYLPKSGYKSEIDDTLTVVVVGTCVFQEREVIESEISRKQIDFRLLLSVFPMKVFKKNLYSDRQ